MVRVVIFFVFMFFSTLIALIVSLLRPFDPMNTWFAAKIFGYGSFFILGLDLDITGEEFLNSSRPCIFISNHQSNFDIFPCTRIVPQRTVSMGKKSMKYIPLFGIMYWFAGNILIDRKNKKKALSTMNAASVALTNKKTSIWIFPEGTRNHGKGLLHFKRGAFYTAIDAQVPVVPVCLSSHKNLNFNKFKSGTVKIRVLDPILTKGLGPDDARELSVKCRDLIKASLDVLDN